MTRFRDNRILAFSKLVSSWGRIVCISAVFFVLVQGALGQEEDVTGPPRGITPQSNELPDQDRTSDLPMRSITDRPGMDDGGIQVGTLSGIDSSGMGLIGPATGGFEQDLWAGSERLVIETLLPNLPVATNSRTMNQLARRLLLTAGPLPEGVTRGSSFLSLRLERLYVAGQVADIAELANMGTAVPLAPGLARYQAEAFLLARDYVSTCSLATSSAEGRNEPFWLQLRTFCFVVAGENAAADLTADLLREQNLEDPSFFALVTRMTTGAEIDIPRGSELDALLLAMHAQVGISPAEDALSGSFPAVLAALALDESFDLGVRLSSAQKATEFGVLTADKLGELYDQVEFSADELSNALTLIADISPARGQALIYRMLKTLTVPSAVAEALRAATTLAVENDSFSTTAELYWPILRGLTPSEPYAEVATDIGRMALLNGDSESAYDWYDIARSSNRSDASAIRDLRILLAVAAPSDRLPWQSSAPLQWLNSTPTNNPDYHRLARHIELLEGLGYPVSRETQLKVLEAPLQSAAMQTSPVVLSRLSSATVSKRLGEVVLLAMIAIGPGGPTQASLSDLLDAFGSLSAMGLEGEARKIALEAVLGAQLDVQAQLTQ